LIVGLAFLAACIGLIGDYRFACDQHVALIQPLSTVPVRPDTVIAAACEATWQDMLDETPPELHDIHPHNLLPAWQGVVLTDKRDSVLFQSQQTPIADCHTVGVTSEVLPPIAAVWQAIRLAKTPCTCRGCAAHKDG
jgi:hypothetical protein